MLGTVPTSGRSIGCNSVENFDSPRNAFIVMVKLLFTSLANKSAYGHALIALQQGLGLFVPACLPHMYAAKRKSHLAPFHCCRVRLWGSQPHCSGSEGSSAVKEGRFCHGLQIQSEQFTAQSMLGMPSSHQFQQLYAMNFDNRSLDA